MKIKFLFLIVLSFQLVGCSDNDSNDATPVATDTVAPVIDAIDNQTISANVTTAIMFVVTDNLSANVVLSATSDTVDVVAEAGLSLAGTSGTVTLSITPVSSALGNTEITITAVDGPGNTSTTVFSVEVIEQQVSATQLILDIFAADANSEPVNISAIVLDQDVVGPETLQSLIDDGE